MRCLNVMKKGDGRGRKKTAVATRQMRAATAVICFAGCGIMIAIDAPVR